MKQRSKIFVVRHAQSQANVTDIIGGDLPLTENGILQAKKRAQDLQHLRFGAAFSSHLVRAHQTATILATHHQLSVSEERDFREREFGIYEGKLYSEAQEKFAAYYKSLEGKSRDEQLRHKMHESMESPFEAVQRLKKSLRKIVHNFPGQNLLVVSHGSVMRAFLIHLGIGGFNELSTRAIANTGYFVLESHADDFILKDLVDIEITK